MEREIDNPIPMLELHAIAEHRRQRFRQQGRDRDAMRPQVGMRERQNLTDELVHVERRVLRDALGDESPDVPHYLGRVVAGLDDVLERGARFVEIGLRSRKPKQARVGVRHDAGQMTIRRKVITL
jgi:hypothetical protein